MTIQAHWSDADIDTLLDFLFSKRSTSADGGNFKDFVWTESAELVNKVAPSKGGPKTKGSCKSKWGKLKETYHIVANIKAQSGFKWDDERGADIDESSAAVWEAYEKRHKGSAPFRNKGWPWYTKVQLLMPSLARGANAYRASLGSQAPLEEVHEPEDDSQSQEPPLLDWSPSPPPPLLSRTGNTANASERIPTIELGPPAVPVQSVTPAAPLPPPVTPAPAPLSGKRPPPQGQSSGSTGLSVKRPRMTEALTGMVDRMDDFTDVFRDVMSGKKPGTESTPSRKTRAMQLVQTVETSLSDKRIVALFDLFQKDVTMADAYLAISREGVRKAWVEARINHVQDDSGDEIEDSENIY